MLQNLINDYSMTNVEFIIGKEKKKIFGHKLVFSKCSPFFKRLFFPENWRNSPLQVMKVTIPDIETEVFDQIKQFVYTSDITFQDQDLFTLLLASKRFELLSLFWICKTEIMNQLTTENCVHFLNKSYQNHFYELTNKICFFIQNNYSKIFQKGKFSLSELPSQLAARIISFPETKLDMKKKNSQQPNIQTYQKQLHLNLNQDLDLGLNNKNNNVSNNKNLNDYTNYLNTITYTQNRNINNNNRNKNHNNNNNNFQSTKNTNNTNNKNNNYPTTKNLTKFGFNLDQSLNVYENNSLNLFHLDACLFKNENENENENEKEKEKEKEREKEKESGKTKFSIASHLSGISNIDDLKRRINSERNKEQGKEKENEKEVTNFLGLFGMDFIKKKTPEKKEDENIDQTCMGTSIRINKQINDTLSNNTINNRADSLRRAGSDLRNYHDSVRERKFHITEMGQKRVLLLTTETHLDYCMDVINSMKASGIDNVEIFRINRRLPKLIFLKKYDSIFFFTSITSIKEPTKIGDQLAEYVEDGGGLIICTYRALIEKTWKYKNAELKGRIVTDNFLPLKKGKLLKETRKYLGKVYQPNHPIMKNVSSFNGGSLSYRISTELNKSKDCHICDIIAEWDDGVPLIALKQKKQQLGSVIILNCWPVSGRIGENKSRYAYWLPSTDGRKIIGNSVKYASTH
ncbi:btb/poz domain-containing [Anaeramoeba flamelloides]|uniref:Btb/poz domain-containing n=1 Tax=Anaeramoeba flamelloides TaxID=1746091 RepID=A0ABQ8Z7H3_9EUKA|nr:btb/poz domain-containing [Anaeramoeba flamelloides]